MPVDQETRSMRDRLSRPYALVSLAILGLAASQVVERTFHPAFRGHDFALGAWMGVCLGVEILGVIRLRCIRCGGQTA